MKNLNNLAMTHDGDGVKWTDDAGNRHHVWLEVKDGKPVSPYRVRLAREMGHSIETRTLYRNPPEGVRSRHGGRETRRLNAEAAVNRPLVAEALRRAETEGLYEAALLAKECAERDKARRRNEAHVAGAREALQKLVDETEDANVRHNAAELLACDDGILLPIFRALRNVTLTS